MTTFFTAFFFGMVQSYPRSAKWQELVALLLRFRNLGVQDDEQYFVALGTGDVEDIVIKFSRSIYDLVLPAAFLARNNGVFVVVDVSENESAMLRGMIHTGNSAL